MHNYVEFEHSAYNAWWVRSYNKGVDTLLRNSILFELNRVTLYVNDGDRMYLFMSRYKYYA